MKRVNFSLCLTVLLAVFSMVYAKAEASQNFNIYYQHVLEVKDVKDVDYARKGVSYAWGKITGDTMYDTDGNIVMVSKKDKNVAYIIKREEVTSEEQLLELMGAESEDELTSGQLALLYTYKCTQGDEIDERSQYSYNDTMNVFLNDTSDIKEDVTYTDHKGKEKTVSYQNINKDFWSTSNGPIINIGSANYENSSSKYAQEVAYATFVHEYCHSIDKTNKEWINPYGKDGSHYYNQGSSEMTKSKAAFVEGWAEYNEMIEFDYRKDWYMNGIATICFELSKSEAKNFDSEKYPYGTFSNGISTYTYVPVASLTADQIWACEGYNCTALYKFATELDNGKQKIYDAFIATRGKIGRDIRTFVKELCKQNPEDIATIGKILDDLSLGKMTDKEFKKFIGNSDEAKAFLEERAAGYPNMNKEESSEAAEAAAGENGSESEATVVPVEDEEEAPALTGTSDEEGSPFKVR